MAQTKVFISYDYDHDLELKNALVGQAALPDSPFAIEDHSVQQASPGWKEDARKRIRRCDQVVVICGEHTDTATGVNVELEIAQEEGETCFLLWGRPEKTCKKPPSAKSTDTIYKWTWDILKKLIGGAR